MRHGEELDNRNSKRAVKADYVSSIVMALLDRRCRKKARVDQRGSGGWFNDSGKASQKTRPSVPMRSSQRSELDGRYKIVQALPDDLLATRCISRLCHNRSRNP